MTSEGNRPEDGETDRAVARVLWITLGLNLGIAVVKMAVGHWAGLVAVYADGLHSLTDGVSNIVGLVSLYFASRPPDADHPYGHQKLEIFAAGGVGLFLLATAGTVSMEVYQKLTGAAVPAEAPGKLVLAVMAVTFAVNLFVASYERRRGRELGSPFLLSDSAHTASDLAVTGGVMVAVVLGWAGISWVDPLAGGLVAIWIFWTGVRIILENADYLADRAQIDPEEVRRAVLGVKGVRGCTDIRSRGTPGKVFVDLSIQVDAAMSVGGAHDLSHEVSDAVRQAIAGIRDVTVHVEPAQLPSGVSIP